MKVLIVTNDFPPRTGGIQSFVHGLAARRPPGQTIVYAPAWPGAAAYDRTLPFQVYRHRTSLMLPSPTVRQRAVDLFKVNACEGVVFGAAAPLGLLAPAFRRAGARRILALTHGHEAGWAALPLTRALLRRIASSVDVMTYLSEYFRVRLARVMSPAVAARLAPLAPGVDPAVFHRGVGGTALKKRLGLAERAVIVCVSRLVPRKGQDSLIRALPQVRAAGGGPPALVLVGSGPAEARLRRLAKTTGMAESVMFVGDIPQPELPAYYDMADVFAMPCRTRRAGLDVEGLGIVYLEASAMGLPVVAGDSGGAPDAVRAGETGYVVRGGDLAALSDRLSLLLSNPAAARAMGEKGRAWIEQTWRWDLVARRFEALLAGEGVAQRPVN